MTGATGHTSGRPTHSAKTALGRRIAVLSIGTSALLAVINVGVGLFARSTSVVATGLEFAGDVMASVVVWTGMLIASRPADVDHPYGHGRAETLAGLVVGIILALGGAGICYRSLQRAGEMHPTPGVAAVWALLTAVAVKAVMSTLKFRVGRRIHSTSLVADAWNDAVDIASVVAALIAVGLTRYDPSRFLAADHYGGFAVGLVVILTGLRVMRDASLDLVDTMPHAALVADIRKTALAVPGALRVEKCYARRSGLQYHVDLHLEVDGTLTVSASHEIATQVRLRLRSEFEWIADVLVHVEPAAQAEELGVSRAARVESPPPGLC